MCVCMYVCVRMYVCTHAEHIHSGYVQLRLDVAVCGQHNRCQDIGLCSAKINVCNYVHVVLYVV